MIGHDTDKDFELYMSTFLQHNTYFPEKKITYMLKRGMKLNHTLQREVKSRLNNNNKNQKLSDKRPLTNERKFMKYRNMLTEIIKLKLSFRKKIQEIQITFGKLLKAH